MDSKLFAQAIIKFLSGLVIVGLLLFLPAGTFSYWQGWLLMGILFVPMFIAGLVMMKKSPDLLRRRLDVKEQEAEQKTVIALSGLMFLAAFLVAGKPVGHRHRAVRCCPPPHVHDHAAPVPRHAARAGVHPFLCDHAGLYPDHRQTHPQ